MKIYLCHIGKTKTSWIRKGEEEYMQKLKRFASVSQELLPSSKSRNESGHRTGDSASIISYLAKAPRAFNILLDERGVSLDSPGLARTIDSVRLNHGSAIRFITGGPYGVTDEVRQTCDMVLSLSDMVLPHELVRVVLVEQIYRAFTILRGESYHHI